MLLAKQSGIRATNERGFHRGILELLLRTAFDECGLVCSDQ